MDDQIVSRVSFTFLGVLIDDRLDWPEHVNKNGKFV